MNGLSEDLQAVFKKEGTTAGIRPDEKAVIGDADLPGERLTLPEFDATLPRDTEPLASFDASLPNDSGSRGFDTSLPQDMELPENKNPPRDYEHRETFDNHQPRGVHSLAVYNLEESKTTEAKIDPESDEGKIYKGDGVDVENPIKEKLGEQEVDVYRMDIDPNLLCPDGRTNKERMEAGEAPYVDRDGKLVKVELHHHGQNGKGPLVELGSDTHKTNHATLHPNLGKGEGRGDDPQWSQQRKDHWQQRASEF